MEFSIKKSIGYKYPHSLFLKNLIVNKIMNKLKKN